MICRNYVVIHIRQDVFGFEDVRARFKRKKKVLFAKNNGLPKYV